MMFFSLNMFGRVFFFSFLSIPIYVLAQWRFFCFFLLETFAWDRSLCFRFFGARGRIFT